MIELGDTVRDRISGFEGVAIGRTAWINGCVRYVVQPPANKKSGTLPVSESFDGDQLVIIKKPKPVPSPKPKGGPMPTPKQI